LVIALLIAGGLVYFGKYKTTPDLSQEGTTTEEQAEEETVLTKDIFSITLPAGWTEIAPPVADILVMAIDSKEEISEEKIKEVGFQTNLSVRKDDLSQYEQIYTLAEYVDSIKTSLIQIIPGITFTQEKQGKVEGRNALFVECESTQEGIDFGTLLVFIEGKDNFLWAISFNTPKISWPVYQDQFYQTAESLRLK